MAGALREKGNTLRGLCDRQNLDIPPATEVYTQLKTFTYPDFQKLCYVLLMSELDDTLEMDSTLKKYFPDGVSKSREEIIGRCTRCKEMTSTVESCCGAPVEYEGGLIDPLEDEE